MLLFLLPVFLKQLTRLSQPISVERYDLYIDAEMEKDMFKGIVIITIDVFQNIDEIEIFSKVKAHELYVDGNKVEFYCNEGSLMIHSGFNVGKHKIKIKFSNEIGTKMNGFYKSKGNIWSTHFEPGDARKAFPCFDQPDLKAVFQITITAPENNTVLSNMDVLHEEINGNLKTTTFNETPKMSTYLVAWAIGPLISISNGKISVYTTEEKYLQGEFALERAEDCLGYFEKYFNIKYPLKKLDLIAIPEFSMGAMENWGLITFRESSLLFHESDDLNEKSNVLSKKGIAETVCHEIAHQWYGNLVTMKWWNDIWLNEGFATWASNMAILETRFKWDNKLYFLDYVMDGLDNDGYLSTHPIENSEDPDQVFDPISYAKSSGIIRMIEDYDKEKFKKNLVKYLKDKKYSNSTSEELTRYLDQDISKWTKQAGFPLVTIKKDGTVLQERFSYLPNEHKDDSIWNIPLKIDWLNGEVEFVSLMSRSIKIKPKTPLFKANAEGVGFYRVFYEDDSIPLRLIKNGLSPADRLNLINDSYALVIRTSYSLKNFIDLSLELVDEENFEVLNNIISVFITLRSKFEDQYDNFNTLLSRFVQNVEIIPSDDLNTASIRALKVKVRQRIDDLEFCKELIGQDRDPIFRQSVFECRMRVNDNETTFKELLKVYNTSLTSDVKNAALFALTQTKNETLGLSLIDLIGDKILLQDSHVVFSGLSINIRTKQSLIEILIKKWPYFKDLFSGNTALLSIILTKTLLAVPEAMKDEVLTFLNKSDFEGVENAVKSTRENLEINTQLRKSIKFK